MKELNRTREDDLHLLDPRRARHGARELARAPRRRQARRKRAERQPLGHPTRPRSAGPEPRNEWACSTPCAVVAQIAFRNLFASRWKTLIVGGIIGFGALLVVIGTSLLDSVDHAMSRSIIGSVAGHIQVYSSKSKDDLDVMGGFSVDASDIEPLDDFAQVQATLLAVPNVARGRADGHQQRDRQLWQHRRPSARRASRDCVTERQPRRHVARLAQRTRPRRPTCGRSSACWPRARERHASCTTSARSSDDDLAAVRSAPLATDFWNELRPRPARSPGVSGEPHRAAGDRRGHALPALRRHRSAGVRASRSTA